MNNTYAVIISRYDENEEQTTLIDQYISADDAIDLMIHIQQNVADANEEQDVAEEEAEENEEESVHVRNGRKGGARVGQVRKCSQCGEPGHTYRTCGKKSSTSPEPAEDEEVAEPEEPSEPAADYRSLRERVKELWEAGVGLEEVFDAFPSEPIPEINAIYRDLERKRHD